MSGTENRERKMRTKIFCTNFLNTARGPGHPGKIPGTSRIPLFENQGRQSFEGGHEVFGHHPFAWKTPTLPGGLQTQKLNLCALFSCLRKMGHYERGLFTEGYNSVVNRCTLSWTPLCDHRVEALRQGNYLDRLLTHWL